MLCVDNVHVQINGTDILSGITFDVAPGEAVAVLGASGSGKSTLLRSLCGLRSISAGMVAWNGDDITRVPTHRRSIGMMFQDHSLFPHLDVAHNIAYGIVRRLTGAARGTRQGRSLDVGTSARVGELLELVGLSGYERRAIDTLSGGEQQRVALARSLAPAPNILLLDEPFGALDRSRREELVSQVSEIVRRLNIATVVVTHDHDEAFTFADRVAVLHDRTCVQIGTAVEVWARPASVAVCELLGFGDGEPAHIEGGELRCTWGSVDVGAAALAGNDDRTGACRVVLRPDAFRPNPDGHFTATVERVLPRNDELQAIVRIDHGPTCSIQADSATRPLDRIRLSLDPAGVLIYSLSVNR